jgi:phosphoserine phosphatase RsbU/P
MSVAATATQALLIADDQADIRLALRLTLKGDAFDVETADSPAAILDAVRRRRFDALLMDLNYTRDTTSGFEGLDVLARLRALDPELPVVVMTAWGTIELAVEAMRRGASDFVLKPWDNAALRETLRRSASRRPGRSRDLESAGRVQRRLLPQQAPCLSTLACAALCVEAGAVGGDGYDFLELGRGRLAVLLADVSGKGVPAALLWASLQATVRGHAETSAEDLVAWLSAVHASFLATTAPEHFATLFLAVYDDATRRLRYVNAGHNPPLLLRAAGGVQRLAPTAPVVGLLDAWAAEVGEVVLERDDTLVVYSDGVTEATSPRGHEFGEGRLEERLRAFQALTVDELPAALLSEVSAFTGGVAQDDRTVVVLRSR